MLEEGAVQKLCSPVATQFRAGRPACGGACVGSVIGAYRAVPVCVLVGIGRVSVCGVGVLGDCLVTGAPGVLSSMAGSGAAPLFECCEVELPGCVPELVACGVGFAVQGGRPVGVDPPEAPFCGERECGLRPKNFFIFLLH